ncbi:MAG: bifunctional oligoribonuclease/PAP phosphatase NrnA [Firmicutes bacterium]|nr:bifunctional oligoribonuclease/PAP phosphatase NrnA [Bacillota bacterium]
MNSLPEIVQFFQERDNFIFVGHENPDPDSLGSMLALFHGLTKIGKQCRMVSGDPVPTNLSWPGLSKIEYIPQDFQPGESCVVVLDCEPYRTGAIAPGVQRAKCLVNIDHHQRGRGEGNLVYVNPNEAATSVIAYRILKELGVAFDLEIATALYGGILGDTGGFRHANTNSEVLSIAAELLDCGVQPAPMAREIFSSQPYDFLKLLGYALSNLQTSQGGRLVWMSLSYDEFQKFNIPPENTDHLVSYARMLDTAEVAMVFREVKPGEIRLGLRANQVDVGALARHLGGGGHKLASGATLKGDLMQVTQEVVDVTEEYLRTGELHERHS